MIGQNNMEKIEQIAEALVALSVKEVNMLANLMKEKYDIAPAAAAVAAVPVASAEGEEGKEQKEKTIFDVELTSAGDTRLRVIKAIKDALSLSLKDAKDFVDGAPQIMKEKVTKEEAEALKKTLEEVGAKITLK